MGSSRRKNSSPSSGGGAVILLLGLGVCALAWPYWGGTYLAVRMGAENPSTTRSVVGWVFEVLWLGFLAAMLIGWIVTKSRRNSPKSNIDVTWPHPPVCPPQGIPPAAVSRRRRPSIPYVGLTRKITPFPTTNVTFTEVDLETTGLDSDTDRIVEVGLVKFSADGKTIHEFATLVNNPGSSTDAVAIHHIRDSDLVGAPCIEDVLPEVFAFMSDTVVVGHNFSFENEFLSAAALRAAIPLPRVVGVCTLDACRNHLDGRAFSLPVMYKTATGEWAHDRHAALGDARAVKEVLLWLLRKAPSAMYFTQDPHGGPPSAVSETCQIRCRPVPLVRASMDNLLASFPQSPRPRKGNPQVVQDYRRLLDTSVDDSRLTMQEASDLTRIAMATGLTGTQLRQLHRRAWDTAFNNEKDVPWTALTPVRRREMFLLADALGLTDVAGRVNAVIADCSEPEPRPEARYLRGLRIAVVGEDTEIIALRERAEFYGAKLAVNVTKTVQWLATTTPDALDSRHESARKLGIPMLTPALAQARLNEAIQDAELKAYERQREIDEFAAMRRQRLDALERRGRDGRHPGDRGSISCATARLQRPAGAERQYMRCAGGGGRRDPRHRRMRPDGAKPRRRPRRGALSRLSGYRAMGDGDLRGRQARCGVQMGHSSGVHHLRAPHWILAQLRCAADRDRGAEIMTRIRVSARDRQAAAAADQQCRLCVGVCLTPSDHLDSLTRGAPASAGHTGRPSTNRVHDEPGPEVLT